jgi:c-di-GMP-binding flagellar brake protein YcgR
MEKRIFPRVNVKAPIRYKRNPRGKFFAAISQNISEGGLGIISNQFIPAWEKLWIEFTPFSGPETVRALAQVVWAQQIRYSDRYQIGIKFTQIDQASRETLSNYVRINLPHRIA